MELLSPGNTRGGWLSSLERELSCHDEIELHVGFYYLNSLRQFNHRQTTFHPLLRGSRKNKFTRFLSRIHASLNNDQEEIEKIKALVDQVQPDIIYVNGTEENFRMIQVFTSFP